MTKWMRAFVEMEKVEMGDIKDGDTIYYTTRFSEQSAFGPFTASRVGLRDGLNNSAQVYIAFDDLKGNTFWRLKNGGIRRPADGGNAVGTEAVPATGGTTCGPPNGVTGGGTSDRTDAADVS